MSWRERISPYVLRARPVATAVERVAQFAVRLQKPTPLGLIGLAATGITALAQEMGNTSVPPSSIETLVSRGQIIAAIKDAGGHVTANRWHDNSETINCVVHSTSFVIGSDGSIVGNIDNALREWLRQAINRILPAHVEIRGGYEQNRRTYEAVPSSLTSRTSEQAAAFIRATLPLLAGGRCILLDGKPGVGKTTLAQIIARDADLGRVVMLENTLVGYSTDHDSEVRPCATTSGGNFREALALLSPGVIIVDDIDKVRISLQQLEAMRSAAKLVILTANNGQYDEVLDGALMRAGRVDEVFSIAPARIERGAPFDRLSDDDWSEVSQWPIAYLNEVRKRLDARPSDIRLDDLRSRMTRKTRSGDKLL